MSGLNKVVWAEGVFLGQQHFQAWDTYQAQRMHFTQKAVMPFCWGLLSLQWSEMALREGRFELQKLECLLPDGRAIEYYRDQQAPVFIDLMAIGRDEFTLILAVPKSEIVEGVSGYQSSGRTGGWVAEFRELADESDATRVREVMIAKPNLLLKTETESLDQMSCLRLVKIQKQYDGEFKVVNDILPACLNTQSVYPVHEIAQSVSDMLSAVARDFSKSREKIGDVSSYSSTELSEFLFHKDLIQLLPEFKSNIHHGKAHPFTLYGQLCRLHQLCATFLQPDLIDRLPEYNHDALELTLPALLNEIRSMLSSKKGRPEDKVELNAVTPGRFESTQIPRYALENYSIFLAVDAKQDNVEWVNRFVQFCKLASPEQLETVLSSGLPGVVMRHVQRLPQKIRIKSGFEYFQITSSGSLWEAVLKSQKFGLFCMGEFTDVTVELIMVEE
ncbi:type VI secretion system baseplate subunit TssK [Reinekea forsetii]|nr:type VI secretion system baseplate subunit TssK [Reinekea forsetii]